MRLEVVLAALITVAVAFAVHVAWWRWARPAADIPSILLTFLVAPALAYAGLSFWPILTRVEWLGAFVLHAGASSAYVQTYPATQARSPSLSILIAVGAAPAGLDRAGIVAALDSMGLVAERVEDLQRNALVRREGDRLVLTAPGRLLARGFGLYRRWLGMRAFGG